MEFFCTHVCQTHPEDASIAWKQLWARVTLKQGRRLVKFPNNARNVKIHCVRTILLSFARAVLLRLPIMSIMIMMILRKIENKNNKNFEVKTLF